MNLFDFFDKQCEGKEHKKEFNSKPLIRIPRELMFMSLNPLQWEQFCNTLTNLFGITFAIDNPQYIQFLDDKFSLMGLLVPDIFAIDDALKKKYPDYKDNMSLSEFVYKKFGLRDCLVLEWLCIYSDIKTKAQYAEKIKSGEIVCSVIKKHNVNVNKCINTLLRGE